jgi:hypothetical protein
MVVAHYTKKLGAGVVAEDGYLEFKGKFKTYTYVVALSKIDYEDSPGMYMYIYIHISIFISAEHGHQLH